MNTLIDAARKMANSEAATGRNVMILVPNSKWRSYALRQYGPYEPGVWIRASTVESSLKSVPLDTLILVGQSHPDWNQKGELYAREKLRSSSTPRIFVFNFKETK